MFALNTNGTGFTRFIFSTGTATDLIRCRGAFIGQHPVWNGEYGRHCGNGTVFTINTDGTGYFLHSFTAFFLSRPYTNSDDAYPYAA